MFKDPLHDEETPYDILNLDPDATHNEVHQALPRFMRDRKNIARLSKAQEAVKKLKNSKDRVGVDIFYYSLGKIDSVDSEDWDILAKLDEFLVVPSVKDEQLYSDLQRGDFSADFREITFNKVKISEINKSGNIEEYKLEVSFDR